MAVDGSVTRPSSSIFWRAVIMLFASLVTCKILVPTEIESIFLAFWKLPPARTRGTLRKQNPKTVHPLGSLNYGALRSECRDNSHD